MPDANFFLIHFIRKMNKESIWGGKAVVEKNACKINEKNYNKSLKTNLKLNTNS